MIDKEKMEDWFYIGIFGIAMIFALISIIKLYLSINSLISIWFDDKYKPLFDAIFSIFVLTISLYFIRERIIKK